MSTVNEIGASMIAAVATGAYLHHLHLSSPDPAALAAFYADVMDMEARQEPTGSWTVHGPARRLRFSQGPAQTLVHAGFALRDRDSLDALRARADAEGLNPSDKIDTFFDGMAFTVVDPDGNRVVFGIAAAESASGEGRLRGAIQHLGFATRDVDALEAFYHGKLGFAISDRVLNDSGKTMTSFMRASHEHHTLACFYQDRTGIDHHCYEAGEWDRIRDWADRFASRKIRLSWGPGRHGPGNNLFAFIGDPDGNWLEVSAELEVVLDRPLKTWPHEERTLNLWGKGILRA